ncbi:MAG: sodium:proton antiporter [Deltaproteobacteria bacterium]|nr:MAG: sodium:proton antiporter [Deltaproteobacteria bacterium]
MIFFKALAIVFTLCAVFGFLNVRFLKLPPTIGLLIFSIVLAICVRFSGSMGVHPGLETWIQGVDFNETLMVGLLSYLLFAGALHVNLDDLWTYRGEIGMLSTIGVLVSTFLVGAAIYGITWAAGKPLPVMYALLFGAMISPTDPIAVLGIMKQAGAPHDLSVKISGESLFNDGIGVVVFLVLAGLATGTSHLSAGHVGHLVGLEIGGGILLGLVLGGIAFVALKSIDDYPVEILITLAVVTGGYALALIWHLSGPIAVVVAGLMIGNHGRRLAMSEKTRQHLDLFWALVDEILNAVLFVLIGLEVVLVSIAGWHLIMGLVAIPVVLFARYACVKGTLALFKASASGTAGVLTWAGLRGGISVALALSLPACEMRELLLTMTYCVVAFSLVVQGLSIRRLLAWYIQGVDGR